MTAAEAARCSPPARAVGWLPGVPATDTGDWRTLAFSGGRSAEDATLLDGGSVLLRVPELSPEALTAVLQRVARARDQYLAELPVYRIVELLDRVASRWLDPASPYRREAEHLLPVITGYSEPAVRKSLIGMLASWRAENLRRLLEEELSDPEMLDGFRPRITGGAGHSRAFGPRTSVHVWSGNVPGLPAQSLAATLLVKSAALGKVSSAEPLFATLLAESIAEVDPRLAECLAVTWWPGGDEDRERAVLRHADAVIAYGGNDAISAIRERVPAASRFLAYGHKISFGAVAREALDAGQLSGSADAAAYDVAKYDQQGCLSPHVVYVERGGGATPRQFAAALGDALSRYAELVPRGALSLDERAAAAAVRSTAELRAMSGEAVQVIADPAGGWTVLYDEDPAFSPSCLNRVVFVKPVDDLLPDVPAAVAPLRAHLQTCGMAGPQHRRLELADRLGPYGVDRVCPLGRMGDVAPTWHHDGRPVLLDLLRWTDVEPDGSAGHWEFAHPGEGLYGR